ncbi:serine/threonine-protein kinase [Actinoallomurus sp. CA-150999]|uniref:serine/threonine-protein kinase n=1 Tax=Actinoallomurus sp. CA-150999 TaxID=3239887 RepID=UPI003D8ABF87
MRSGLELNPGLVLAGRYQLEAPLGRGGMGEVWHGTDLRLRRAVAIKVLSSDLAVDQNAVARFRREAETAAALQHPGITVVFDVDVHQDATGATMFLVMELLDGRDLRTLIGASPGGLAIPQVLSFATQIADALAAAHGRGVVHRDIKAQNLLVSPDGRVKICDFGIAHLVNATTRLTMNGAFLGTPGYMAPEQFRAEPTDHRTDLYALGCVVYEMLTGSLPFSGGELHALMYQHLNQAPPAPSLRRPETPPHLDRLVLDLLAKSPTDRPTSAQDVASFLRSSTGTHGPEQAGAPPFAHTSPDSGPVGRRDALGDHRRALIAGGACLAGLALVGVGAFALWPDSTGKKTASGAPRSRPSSQGSGSVSPQQTASAGGTPPTGMAKPGQTFRIGQTAMVPFLNGGAEKLAITVTSIEKGAAGDLAALNGTGEQTDGMTPFYVRYTVKNLGGGVPDLSGTSINMDAVLPGGAFTISTQPHVAFPKCADSPPNNGQLPKGSSYQPCALFLVPTGIEMTGVEWVQGSSDTYDHPRGVYWKQ